MEFKSLSFTFGIIICLLSGCCSWRQAETICVPENALSIATQEAVNDPLIEAGANLPSDWWTLFNDDQLTCLINIAFNRNPTLQEAYTNILQAQASADSYRSSLFPYISWGGDIGRNKLSRTGVIPFGTTTVPVLPGAGLIPEYYTLYETQLNLKYDFDIWGKNRNTLRAALGEVQAKIADSIFARLELGIAVAAVYFQLQIDYKREAIAKQLVENRTQYQNFVALRSRAGLDTASNRNTANFNVADASYALLQIQSDIAVKKHQLQAYLASSFEEEVCAIIDLPLPKVPFPCDLPLHLIALRPDITAQLWLIESAGLQIDVAKAAFYPDFNITALFGFQTIHPKELFRWASSYFIVDPAFTLPIFDAGLRVANLHGSEVNYDSAILKYNDLVVNAVKEVLDGISLLHYSEKELNDFQTKYEAQVKNLDLTNLKVANHINSALDYLTSQQNTLLAQDQEILAYGNTLQALLSLIKSLGGGYDASCGGS